MQGRRGWLACDVPHRRKGRFLHDETDVVLLNEGTKVVPVDRNRITLSAVVGPLSQHRVALRAPDDARHRGAQLQEDVRGRELRRDVERRVQLHVLHQIDAIGIGDIEDAAQLPIRMPWRQDVVARRDEAAVRAAWVIGNHMASAPRIKLNAIQLRCLVESDALKIDDRRWIRRVDDRAVPAVVLDVRPRAANEGRQVRRGLNQRLG